jgi:hypothetical protein
VALLQLCFPLASQPTSVEAEAAAADRNQGAAAHMH